MNLAGALQRVAIATFALLTACQFHVHYIGFGKLPHHMDVVIDSTFREDSRQDILSGARAWTDATGGRIRFDARVESPSEIGAELKDARIRDVVYVLWARDSAQIDCGTPPGAVVLGCERPPWRVDLNAPAIDAYGGGWLWRQVIAHEIGHVLMGQAHTDAPRRSVMDVSAAQDAPAPTLADVARLCAAWDCSE